MREIAELHRGSDVAWSENAIGEPLEDTHDLRINALRRIVSCVSGRGCGEARQRLIELLAESRTLFVELA